MAKKGGTPLGYNSRSISKGKIGNIKTPTAATRGSQSSGGNSGRRASGKVQGKPTIGSRRSY